MANKELWWKYDASSRSLEHRQHKVRYYLWKYIGRYVFKCMIGPVDVLRVAWLRLFGAQIGKHNHISNNAIVALPVGLKMGNNNSIDDYVYISASGVIIENNCSISIYAKFITDGHDVRSRSFTYSGSPAIIGSSSFIGANSFVMGGVKIGTFVTIGANSFVIHDIKENTIAFGNPCKERKERIPKEEFEKYSF